MNSRFTALVLLLAFSATANAHFGSILPDKSIVEDQKDSTITLTAAFNHPMEQTGMTMAKPKSVTVYADGKKTDITNTLQPTKVLEKDAWTTTFKPARPGLYEFVVEPEPYWEPAEDKFIVHYSKLMIPVFGEEGEWGEPLGLKTEIVPLTRPFGNYVGNVFRGKVLIDGKPAPNVPVEIEYYNKASIVKAPSDTFVTQVVHTDDQGVFAYGVPWAGWWGFAALSDADYKLKQDGQDKDVELGAILWTEFVKPQL